MRTPGAVGAGQANARRTLQNADIGQVLGDGLAAVRAAASSADRRGDRDLPAITKMTDYRRCISMR